MAFVVFYKKELDAHQRSRFPNPDSIPNVNIPVLRVDADSLEQVREAIGRCLEEGKWQGGFPVHDGSYIIMRLDGVNKFEKVDEFEV